MPINSEMSIVAIHATPELDINKTLYSQRPMPPHVRREQRIVWNLFKALSALDFEPQKIDNGDEVVQVRSWKAAMEELFNLDDAFLIIKKDEQGYFIRFVFGNDLDVISDYSYKENSQFTKLMDSFHTEVYA